MRAPRAQVPRLGETTELTGVRYLGRSGCGTPGRIKDYCVYVSDQPLGLIPATP